MIGKPTKKQLSNLPFYTNNMPKALFELRSEAVKNFHEAKEAFDHASATYGWNKAADEYQKLVARELIFNLIVKVENKIMHAASAHEAQKAAEAALNDALEDWTTRTQTNFEGRMKAVQWFFRFYDRENSREAKLRKALDELPSIALNFYSNKEVSK